MKYNRLLLFMLVAAAATFIFIDHQLSLYSKPSTSVSGANNNSAKNLHDHDNEFKHGSAELNSEGDNKSGQAKGNSSEGQDKNSVQQNAKVTDDTSEFAVENPQFSNPEFQNWFTQEIATLGSGVTSSTKDQNEKVKALKDWTKKIDTTLAGELKDHALNNNASGNAKVLSVYLLTQAGKVATKTLTDFVKAPLNYTKPEQAHSLNETRRMQERSLRIMAIDNLAKRAKTDNVAMQQLTDLISTISDDYIANYIRKKLAELQ